MSNQSREIVYAAAARFAAAVGLPLTAATDYEREQCRLHGVRTSTRPTDSSFAFLWLEGGYGGCALYLETSGGVRQELFRYAEDLTLALNAATDGAYMAQLQGATSKVEIRRRAEVAEAWFRGLWGPGVGRLVDKLKVSLGVRAGSTLAKNARRAAG